MIKEIEKLMKEFEWDDKQSEKRMIECCNKTEILKYLLPMAQKQDAFLNEAIEILKRNLKDCDSIDKVCQMAQVHSFDLMRKEIMDFLEKAKGNDA